MNRTIRDLSSVIGASILSLAITQMSCTDDPQAIDRDAPAGDIDYTDTGARMSEDTASELSETMDTAADLSDTADETSDPSPPDGLLIDDCDDPDNLNAIGGEWGAYDDAWDGSGESDVLQIAWNEEGVYEMEGPGFGETGYAARMSGTTGSVTGWDNLGVFTTLGQSALCPDPLPTEIQLFEYTGVRFLAKATFSPGEIYFIIPHLKDGADGNCLNNGYEADTLIEWGDYRVEISSLLTEDWSEVSIPFDALSQPNWRCDTCEVTLETVLDHAKEFVWQYQTYSSGTIDLWIDDLALY